MLHQFTLQERKWGWWGKGLAFVKGLSILVEIMSRLSFNPFILFLTLLSMLISTWVLAAGVLDFSCGKQVVSCDFAFQFTDPFQLLYEDLGGTDDDNDTGFAIVYFLLPLISITLAGVGMVYKRWRGQPIWLERDALIIGLLSTLPTLISIVWYTWFLD